MKKAKLPKVKKAQIRHLSKQQRGILAVVVLIVVAAAIFGGIQIGKDLNKQKDDGHGSLAKGLTEEQKAQIPEIGRAIQAQDEVQKTTSSKELILTQTLLSCDTTCKGAVQLSEKDTNNGFVSYQVNEQTKLIQGGQPQDLKQLDQLAQAKQTVSIKLQPNDPNVIAEISY